MFNVLHCVLGFRHKLLHVFFLCGIFKVGFAINKTELFTDSKNVTVKTDTNVLIFSQPQIDDLIQGTNKTVYFNYTGGHRSNLIEPLFQVTSADDTIAKVLAVKSAFDEHETISDFSGPDKNESRNKVLFLDSNDTWFQYSLTVSGEFMGRTHLKFMTPDALASSINKYNTEVPSTNTGENSTQQRSDISAVISSLDGVEHWQEIPEIYDVSVIRKETWVDYVFIGVVTLVVLCANIFMGVKIKLEVVKEVLKKPFAPAIGFVSQFVFMPLVAFAIVRLLKLEGGQALGMFAAGCAPGGGASNMYTYILGGDVSLSVTMTVISTMASFAMIPIWLYTLGQHLIDENYDINIPFTTIFFSLIGILFPVGLGMLIQYKKPNLVVKVVKYLKPVFIILIIFIFSFGIWVNRYIFRLFTLKLLIAGALLPYIGFILSGIAATICRQPLNRIVTIIIETGIQNTGIPIILMRFSLPQPESDLSLISPVLVSAFTPIPLWTAFFIKEIYQRWCKKKNDKNTIPFQRVNTDSDASPWEEDAVDLEQATTFDRTSNNRTDGYSMVEDAA